jgi:hypothetical protein
VKKPISTRKEKGEHALDGDAVRLMPWNFYLGMGANWIFLCSSMICSGLI